MGGWRKTLSHMFHEWGVLGPHRSRVQRPVVCMGAKLAPAHTMGRRCLPKASSLDSAKSRSGTSSTSKQQTIMLQSHLWFPWGVTSWSATAGAVLLELPQLSLGRRHLHRSKQYRGACPVGGAHAWDIHQGFWRYCMARRRRRLHGLAFRMIYGLSTSGTGVMTTPSLRTGIWHTIMTSGPSGLPSGIFLPETGGNGCG